MGEIVKNLMYNKMTVNKIDLSKILKKYRRGWVALSQDYKKVLFSAADFETLMNKVDKAGQKDRVVLIPASQNYRGFIGQTGRR